jgi:hypothetical protein
MADRQTLGGSTPQGSIDRRAVDVGGARTPAGARSSHHKVGRSQGRSAKVQTVMNVGIDVSKQHLEVAVRPTAERFSVTNDQKGQTELCRRLAKLRPERIVLKPTRSP